MKILSATKIASALAAYLALVVTQSRGEPFEGIVTISESRGGLTKQTIYTRKGDQLRIENVDKSRPNPINILDLAAKKLTIVYPHNSSFVRVDLTDAEPQACSALSAERERERWPGDFSATRISGAAAHAFDAIHA
jgi:hypothetical protein